ncbi:MULTISPECIES: hypothetical protein [unclassified Streptomyces]|uniref:hypothetical protein n=1 Tax=unclassified Streptomyces TaxID=2593676 RepID=UPI002DDB8A24|nr:hypothetical protein [Streptomyces sp. NBC_01445]WSE06873.1 hypothetical protein OG574_28190 [Streptomyces sp. NBC_01445]
MRHDARPPKTSHHPIEWAKAQLPTGATGPGGPAPAPAPFSTNEAGADASPPYAPADRPRTPADYSPYSSY